MSFRSQPPKRTRAWNRHQNMQAIYHGGLLLPPFTTGGRICFWARHIVVCASYHHHHHHHHYHHHHRHRHRHGGRGGAPIGAGGSWPPLFEAKGDGGHNVGIIHISHIALITPLHSRRQLFSDWRPVDSEITAIFCPPPHWPKSGGSKNFFCSLRSQIVPPLSKPWPRPCMVGPSAKMVRFTLRKDRNVRRRFLHRPAACWSLNDQRWRRRSSRKYQNHLLAITPPHLVRFPSSTEHNIVSQKSMPLDVW